jgi:hypothetical protein
MDEDFTSEFLLRLFTYGFHVRISVVKQEEIYVFLLDLHLYLSFDRGWIA